MVRKRPNVTDRDHSHNDVASAAAARAIVAGMIVGPRERQDGVEQASFLEAEKNGIGAQPSPEPAVAEFVVRLAGIFFPIGIADFSFLAAAPLKNAQDIPGL